jgi:creatinine amidohydrolase/Fe(II)-dependent formamide hydrolase-like protein
MTDRSRASGRAGLLAALAALAGLLAGAPAWAAGAGIGPATVSLEALSSSELRARIAAGTTTVLLPIGGTEQNGPHMALGKHNRRAEWLATRIAEKLGRSVVAPVIAYVPEGDISPPSQHMRWTGTLSIPEAAFEAVIEGAVRSLRQHGFRDVVLLPDHGGYLKSLERVTARLNQAFAGPTDTRVFALTAYYQVTQTDYVAALKAKGISEQAIGQHAGLADTSLMLAIDPALVRSDVMLAREPGSKDGVNGDPRQASAELGRLGTDLIIEASVAAIRARLQQRSPSAGAGATMANDKSDSAPDKRKPQR